MQSIPCKTAQGVPVEKVVLLYVVTQDNQLVDEAGQLGVTVVAVPSAKKLVSCTEELWLGGNEYGKWWQLYESALTWSVVHNCNAGFAVSKFEVFLWTKEAASLLKRAPAVSRRMLFTGLGVARVDDGPGLQKYLVCCNRVMPCQLSARLLKFLGGKRLHNSAVPLVTSVAHTEDAFGVCYRLVKIVRVCSGTDL